MIAETVFAGRLPDWDAKTFFFASPEPRRFAYLPGQFLTFDFNIGGAVVNRCYTIASTPTRPHSVSITVKKKPGGAVSPWLHETMRPGVSVKAAGPLGVFSFTRHPARKYLFMSGGSGITPAMSMTRAHYHLGDDSDILFVHFARAPADIIFRRELELMSAQLPNLRVVHVCEADSPGEAWGGFRGRVSSALLQQIAPDLAERVMFNCGPAPFMAATRDALASLGFAMAQYHEESFDFGALTEPAPAPAAGAQFTVEFSKTRRSIKVAAGQHILDAARAEGMRLPSSCTKGMCGTCKSKLLSGQVEMHHQGGIRAREIDAGMILLCCSRPLTDLVIER
jgi:ferredoxin-NADP reductase